MSWARAARPRPTDDPSRPYTITQFLAIGRRGCGLQVSGIRYATGPKAAAGRQHDGHVEPALEGAHKLNNTLGQARLVLRMGKGRVVAETGAGQHGVATAVACARLSLPCEVFTGAEDVRRQAPNVQCMKLFGAAVHSVESGTRTRTRRPRLGDERADHLPHRQRRRAQPLPFAGARLPASSATRRAQMLEETGRFRSESRVAGRKGSAAD